MITGSSWFEASGEKSTVAQAARSLSEAFDSPGADGGDICQVKELGCENDGGLEARPSLDPA
ncbi:hypothetical protein [Streptomyces anulatus]|uniref:hypothetical protein n=1 Tax=Streptomyces anulatus TaxID=1892 RepID=UPI0020B6B130|nr:hypothetical protein [Streptomyces anulatus]